MRPLSESLNPGVRGRELFGWAMYDFANSGYTTVVITAVFAAYFVGGVAGGAPWATLAWTSGLSVSYAIVMLTMPGLGAWADRHAAKKRLLVLTTLGCVLSTAALAWVGPGDVVLALALLILSNAFFSCGESLTAAFLPELARPQAMGRVSGWGWALGYLGGMLSLGICLAYVLSAQARQESAAQFVPVTMWITAAIYGLAASVWTVWLWMTGLRHVPAGQAGVFTVMLPVSAALVGVAALGEAMGPLQLCALGLALAGVVLATAPTGAATAPFPAKTLSDPKKKNDISQ